MTKSYLCKASNITNGDLSQSKPLSGRVCVLGVSEVHPLTKDPTEYFCEACSGIFSPAEYKRLTTVLCKCGKTHLTLGEICWYCNDIGV